MTEEELTEIEEYLIEASVSPWLTKRTLELTARVRNLQNELDAKKEIETKLSQLQDMFDSVVDQAAERGLDFIQDGLTMRIFKE